MPTWIPKLVAVSGIDLKESAMGTGLVEIAKYEHEQRNPGHEVAIIGNRVQCSCGKKASVCCCVFVIWASAGIYQVSSASEF